MNTVENSLKTQWETLLQKEPHLRIRNAAEQLGVSEVALLATQIGNQVTRLRPEFANILLEVEKLGKVMGLTRNEACVHERKGVYLNGDFSNPHAGLFVGEDIDQRMFIGSWQSAFAVVDATAHGVKKSLQFFGKDGLALHKIFLTQESDDAAFDALVSKYQHENQEDSETTIPVPLNLEEKKDGEIDIVGFQKAWIDLKDTHEFFGMLRKFGVTRTQALRLAPVGYATPIDKQKIVMMLENAASTKLPIMVFVGNRGNIQIHTGLVRKTMWHGDWFNVMDPDFNLHLDMSKIAQTWIVKKPTEDGMVTAIEVFNEMGEIIVQFFGKRKPGIPELKEWQDLVASL
jgi:putative hemin transport protein